MCFNICILIFFTTFVWNIPHFKKNLDIYHILIKLDYFRHIFEKNQISDFIKIGSVGAELLHVDGRTRRS